jgi:predicted outer membrane repeat protein
MIYIWKQELVIINGSSGRVVINDGIAGTDLAMLNKSSSGLFLLGGANQYFRGMFLQTGGTTTVVGNYFTGKSSITSNSVLEFSTGAVLEGGIISLWDEAVINITKPNNLTFSGEITGTDGTNISKPSSGTLTLSGNNSGFKGTFLQSSGTTKIETGSGISTYFAGLSSITNGSILEIGNNGKFANEGEKIELWTNGGLRITKSNGNLNLNGQVEGDGRITKSVLEWENAEFVGTIGLWEGGQLKLKNSSDIELSGQVEGIGTIEKDVNSVGNLLLKGNNSKFNGIFKLSSGQAIVEDDGGTQYFTGITSITTEGVLVLGQGAEVLGGCIELWNVSGDMNTAGKLDITKTDESISFSTVAVLGNGVINKTGNTVLNIVGDCTGFTGTFFEIQGRTVVSGNYFTGYSSITGSGEIELSRGGSLSGGVIGLWEGGALYITNPTDMEFSGGTLEGNGYIEKSSSATLRLDDHSIFKGVYHQSSGTTVSEGRYFSGTSSITGQSMLVMANGSDFSGGGTIELWDQGVLEITTFGDLTFSGEVRGTLSTKIIKTSTGTLTLIGDNSGFQGLYLQSSGRTLISGKYFIGYSSITDASILELGNGSDLSGGGTIGLWDSGVMNIKTGKDLEITGNIEGDAFINKTSSCTLSLSGDNSGFLGMFIQSSGTTIVNGNYFSGISSIGSSVLELRNGSDITRSRAIYLNRNGILSITSDDLTSFGANQVYGTMANGAVIEKSGLGELKITGDNGTFGGLFLQINGTTTVSADYFGETSISSITGGVLNFVDGSSSSIKSRLQLWQDGVFQISKSGDLSISEDIISGDGKIFKVGSGTFTIAGVNRGFVGEFKQNSGTTIVPDSTYLFIGTNTIENSLLKVTMPDICENREIDYRVFLSTGGILEHESTVNDNLSTTLTGKIEFVGDNARAIFKGNGYNGTWYVLEDKIPDSGANNEVQFVNCYVDVDSDTYTGPTTYKFTNATIDIDFEDERHFDYDIQPSTRIVQFDNLVTSNTVLNTTIVMISPNASGSMLVVNNNSGETNKIKLGVITVGELNGELGHIETHTVKLLDRNIEFERDSESTIATLAYEYSITIDPANSRNVIIDAYKVTSGDSLNNMNTKEGNRALNFSFDSTADTYYPNADLDDMVSGSFYVEGHDDFNGKSNIVARSNTTGQRVSLFKINQEVDFQLMRVELISAQGEQGAALAVATNTASVLTMGVTFTSNTATDTGGGAIYASNGAKIVLNRTKFMGNSATAGNGGALYIDDGSEITFSGELQVIGNSASGTGGAIYVNNATLNVGIDTTSAKVFSGNTSGGVSNGIYLAGNSIINFGASGENGAINMYDAIGSEEGSIGEVNLNGGTVFNLQTNGGTETIVPNLNIKGQSQFNIIGETEVRASSSITVGTNATLKIDGTAGYGLQVHVGNRFVHQGLLEMNLFGEAAAREMGRLKLKSFDLASSDDSSYDSGDSDLINVDGGKIIIEGSSKLSLKTNDAFGNLATAKWRAYKLMKYGKEGSYEGNFGTITFVGATLPKSYIMRYDYLDEYRALLVEGYARDRTKFASLNLCFNQTEAAKTLDYFCDEAYNGEPGAMSANLSGDAKKLGDKLQDFMNALDDGVEDITPHDIGGAGKNIAGLKDALFDLSGYFISNVIISRAYDDAKRDVYNRIYNYKEYEEPAKGIWAQAKGAIIDTDKDGESPNTFKINNTGMLAGFDMMTSSTTMAGLYVKQNKSSISQGSDLHKGEVNSWGLGLYGGIVKEKYDIKGLVSFSADNYDTTRCLRFENRLKAKGQFSGVSGILDIEAGYRIAIASSSVLGKVKLRPYVGAGLALIHTNSFTESGGDIWNLEVKANDYVRTGLVGGIGFTGQGEKFRWNISCGLDCMLSGRNEEITNRFTGGYSLPNGIGNRDFRSRSVTLDAVSVRSDIGFGYYVLDGLEAYCSGDIKWSSMAKDMYGNIGVRYSFGKWINKNISEVKTGNDKIKQFRINAVLFEFGKSDIKPEAEKEIKELAKKIGKKYKFEKIRIEGHTDSHGSDAYNKKLSLARAHAVHEVFAKYGIPTAKIEKIGHGESKPIDSNENEEGRAKNRRVEIFVDLY